jgi:hypothetical protein
MTDRSRVSCGPGAGHRPPQLPFGDRPPTEERHAPVGADRDTLGEHGDVGAVDRQHQRLARVPSSARRTRTRAGARGSSAPPSRRPRSPSRPRAGSTSAVAQPATRGSSASVPVDCTKPMARVASCPRRTRGGCACRGAPRRSRSRAPQNDAPRGGARRSSRAPPVRRTSRCAPHEIERALRFPRPMTARRR